MTSSSDGEPLKRRVLVRNLPPSIKVVPPGRDQQETGCKISKADIRRWFSPYGPIACVHLSSSSGYGDSGDGNGRRHAFVTFEDESCALACAAAFASLSPSESGSQQNNNVVENGADHSDSPPPGISVVMDRYRDGTGHWPSLPLHPIRREAFMRSSGVRNWSANSSGNLNSHGHMNHFVQSRALNASVGNVPLSSRSVHQCNRNPHPGSASPSHRIVQHLCAKTDDSNVMQEKIKINCDNIDIQLNENGLESQLFDLLDVERYPHIVEQIFCNLSASSLRKCRILCHKFKDIVDNFILGNPIIFRELQSRWKEAECSYYPVVPTSDLADEHNPESKYRNVLALKSDAFEIFIALDNGNVEVYDRERLMLTYTIVGKFSVSPSVLDISDTLILVGYTASTFGKHRMTTSGSATRGSFRQVASGNHMQNGRKGPVLPQNSWWKIFCRKTKQHIRTIEKTQVTRLYALSLKEQKTNKESKDSSKIDLIEIDSAQTKGRQNAHCNQVNTNIEETSSYDYSYSEARLGPNNLIYFHSRQSVLSVDCNITIPKTPKEMKNSHMDDESSKSSTTISDNISGPSHSNSNPTGAINIARIASIAEMPNSIIRSFDINLNIIVVGVKRIELDKSENSCHSNYLFVYEHPKNNRATEDDRVKPKTPSSDIYTSEDDEDDQNIHQKSTTMQHSSLSIESGSITSLFTIPLLASYSPPGTDSDFDDTKCYVDSIQLRYPLCLVQLSNNGGSFEHVSNLGQPYVCLVFVDVEKGIPLRTLTFDQTWMRSALKKFGDSSFVPYDSDTSILVTKFDCTHLVIGFGSFSSRNDGCIAVLEMSDILKFSDNTTKDCRKLNNRIMSNVSAIGSAIDNYELPLYLLSPPTFHWSGWDDHCGGVNAIELDR